MRSTERYGGCRDASRDVQLDLYPSLFLGRVDGGQLLRLGTGFDNIALSIVPDGGGDLGVSSLEPLSREPVLHDRDSPRVSIPTNTRDGEGDDGCKVLLRLKRMGLERDM